MHFSIHLGSIFILFTVSSLSYSTSKAGFKRPKSYLSCDKTCCTLCLRGLTRLRNTAVEFFQMSSSEMVRVADFPKLPDERHNCVFSGNKIWFFGQKFLDQPTFHFGHFVTFAGANTTAFNTDTNNFEASRPFAPISTEENLAELIFVFQSRIYLLLYVHFGGFRVTQLFSFDEINGSWAKVADVQTSPANEIDTEEEKNFKQTLVLVDGEAKEGRYFVSFVDHQIRVHLLKMSANSTSWEIVGSIPDAINLQRIQPTAAVFIQNSVFIQGGVHGCGFRYQPLSMLKFYLIDQTAVFKEIASEDNKPFFAFSGATAQLALPKSNAWVHIAGKNAAGMTGSTFNGQVWMINKVDSEQPEWQKKSLEIADPKDGDYQVVGESVKGFLFAFSKNFGVLKGQLNV